MTMCQLLQRKLLLFGQKKGTQLISKEPVSQETKKHTRLSVFLFFGEANLSAKRTIFTLSFIIKLRAGHLAPPYNVFLFNIFNKTSKRLKYFSNFRKRRQIFSKNKISTCCKLFISKWCKKHNNRLARFKSI